jgi:diguanylate cyclase (GGDEF)-like protein
VETGAEGNGRGAARQGSAAGHLAREVSALQAELLGRLHEEMAEEDSAAFAVAAQELAEAFGAVTAATVDPLASRPAEPAHHPRAHPSLYKQGQMRRRLDQLIEVHRRYRCPFSLVVFDVEGPATRNGVDTALSVVAAALRDSVRLVDDAFRLEEDALCVLAPNQDTVGGVQMAERLLARLEQVEAVGGLRVRIFAGVVACPEHGEEAERLLHRADEAMWRARAVGQPVGVGALQDR